MEEKIKQRILGGLVLAGLVAIILSFLFHNSRPSADITNADHVAAQQNLQIALPAQPVQPVQPVQPAQSAQPAQSVQSTVSLASNSTQAQPAVAQAATVSEPTEQPGVTTASVTTSSDALNNDTQASSTVTANPSNAIAQSQQPVTQIQSTATTPPISNAHAWVIQLGAFSDLANAKKLVAALHKKHFDAYLRHEHRDGKIWSVVFVGPEMSEYKSIKIRNELKRSLNLTGVVRKYES